MPDPNDTGIMVIAIHLTSKKSDIECSIQDFDTFNND